ncbi:MAG: VanZ family protein [Paludibacteraceae bacterium]|nr:VanZ family protein [Paludibacteraceae bacterium]
MIHTSRHTLWAAYLPTLLVLATITYLSLASGNGLPHYTLAFPHADKLIHVAMYCGLGLVLAAGMQWRRLSTRRILGLGFGLPTLFGGLIELIQPYFPPRTCELGDFIADGLGAATGVLLVYLLWTRRCSTR